MGSLPIASRDRSGSGETSRENSIVRFRCVCPDAMAQAKTNDLSGSGVSVAPVGTARPATSQVNSRRGSLVTANMGARPSTPAPSPFSSPQLSFKRPSSVPPPGSNASNASSRSTSQVRPPVQSGSSQQFQPALSSQINASQASVKRSSTAPAQPRKSPLRI